MAELSKAPPCYVSGSIICPTGPSPTRSVVLTENDAGDHSVSFMSLYFNQDKKLTVLLSFTGRKIIIKLVAAGRKRLHGKLDFGSYLYIFLIPIFILFADNY